MGSATFTVCALLTCPSAATTTGPEVAPSGTRATRNESELITTPPSTSPKCTRGRWYCCGRNPEPAIRTSPPARASTRETDSMRGPPVPFFLPRMRSENPMRKALVLLLLTLSYLSEKTEVQQEMHRPERVQTSRHIV